MIALIGEFTNAVEPSSVVGGDRAVEGVISELLRLFQAAMDGNASWIVLAVVVVGESGLSIAAFPVGFVCSTREEWREFFWITGAGKEVVGADAVVIPGCPHEGRES